MSPPTIWGKREIRQKDSIRHRKEIISKRRTCTRGQTSQIGQTDRKTMGNIINYNYYEYRWIVINLDRNQVRYQTGKAIC